MPFERTPSNIDISQKKLYEKLIILEKYCIKLEKRVTTVETTNKELKQALNMVITTKKTITSIPTSTATKTKKVPVKPTTEKTHKSGTKKVKKIFDKYNMKPVNI